MDHQLNRHASGEEPVPFRERRADKEAGRIRDQVAWMKHRRVQWSMDLAIDGSALRGIAAFLGQ